MSTYTVRWIYGDATVDLAISRGWDPDQHTNALALPEDGHMPIDGLGTTREDAIGLSHPFNYLSEQEAEDAIGLSHPFNYLSEQEVEDWERTRP